MCLGGSKWALTLCALSLFEGGIYGQAMQIWKPALEDGEIPAGK